MKKKRYMFLLFFLCLLFGTGISGITAVAMEQEEKQQFYSYEKELTEEQETDLSKNYLYKTSALIERKKESEGILRFFFTGTSHELIRQIQTEQTKNGFTILFPDAEYLLEMKEFTEWENMLSGLEVSTGDNGSVLISIFTKKEMSYSYTFDETTLEFCLYYDMDFLVPESYKKYALVLLKPKDVTIRSITNEDLYEKKRFTITIKGKYKDFYKRNPMLIHSSKAKKVAVSEEGGKTIITVKTTSLQGYKIYEKDNFIVVKMGSPDEIYSSIVVLDAGHGGKDSGACAHGMKEKNLNYQIIYTMMKKYFSGNAPDIKVYWTRKTDTFITLGGRAAFADRIGADVFISLHMNMAYNKSANGTEVYYSKSNNSADFDGLTSKKMAYMFKNRLLHDLHTNDRGVKSAGFYVIKHNTVPAILIELGFISGNRDHKKLKKESFRKKAAKSIYVGIVQLFLNYETGR